MAVAVTYYTAAKRCYYVDGTRFRPTGDCDRRVFRVVSGRRNWKLVLPRRLPRSLVVFTAQAVDLAGNRSKVVEKVTLLR